MGNKTDTKNIRFAMFSETLGDECKISTSKYSTDRSYTNFRNGSNVPNYKALIAAGEDATGALNARRYDVEHSNGLWTYQNDKTKPWTFPCARSKTFTLRSTRLGRVPSIQTPSYNGTLLTKANNEALIGIRRAIQNESQKFSGLTMLGEARSTIRQLKSPLKALRQKTGVFADKSARLQRKKLSTADVVADTWLEYAFGIAPLINDISGIAEAAKAKQDRGVQRLSFTGNAESATSTKSWTWIAPGFTVDYTTTILEKCKVKYTVGYKADVQGSTALDRIIDGGGFNVSQVVPTAWELVPWSFLIDYFVNVGDVLNAATTSTENVNWSYSTIIREKEERWDSFILRTKSSGYYINAKQIVAPSYSSKVRDVSRASAELGFPTIRFQMPGSSIQFMNMAALAKLR